MSVESSFNYPSDLNASYPAAGDNKSEGDDHLRGIKTVLKTTFPGLTGAVTASQSELNILDGATLSTAELNILDGVTASAAEINVVDGITASTAELNIMDGVTATAAEINALDGITASVTELNFTDGVTSPIQTQLDSLDNLKAPKASPTFTGTPAAPTATVGTSTTQIATTAFVAATSLVSALPGQLGNSGKVITTDGTNASWATVDSLQTAASQAEMEAGTEPALRTMTPLRVAQAITAQVPLLIPVATQAEQEAGSSTTKFVSPGRQHFHPSAAKAWLKCNVAGAVQASYNITSVTDTGTGIVDVTIATDFSSAEYAVACGALHSSAMIINVVTQAAGTFQARSYDAVGTVTDPTNYYFACYGDQA